MQTSVILFEGGCDALDGGHYLQWRLDQSHWKQTQAGAAEAGNLLAGSVPHDDLAVVATPRDDLRLQGVALEAEHLVWGLQDKLGMDGVPEVPHQHSMRGCSSS